MLFISVNYCHKIYTKCSVFTTFGEALASLVAPILTPLIFGFCFSQNTCLCELGGFFAETVAIAHFYIRVRTINVVVNNCDCTTSGVLEAYGSTVRNLLGSLNCTIYSYYENEIVIFRLLASRWYIVCEDLLCCKVERNN